MDIEFGYASIDDIDKVLNIWQSAWVYNKDEDQIDILRTVIEYDDKALIIGRYQWTIICSCMLIFHPFQSFIYRFSVHSSYQKQRVWIQLAGFIEATLIARWMYHPTLFVETDNEVGKKFWISQWRENLYKVDCFVKNLENR